MTPAGMGHEMMLQGGSQRRNADDHQQFAEYVRAHAADLPFLSQEEERQLIRAGVARFTIDFDEARWLAVGILHDNQVALERHLDHRLEGVLHRYSKTGRRINTVSVSEISADLDLKINRVRVEGAIYGNLRVAVRRLSHNFWRGNPFYGANGYIY